MLRRVFFTIILFALLAGCMYPDELRQENQIPPGEWIGVVQRAVEQFQKDTGVLPLKTRPADTPIYEKYVIDFGKLLGTYLGTLPANAFENGGNYLYVLVTPQTLPQVKLLDLPVLQRIGDVQKEVDQYRLSKGKLPLGEPVAPHFYVLDFGQLNMEPVQVKSFYSGLFLTLIVHESGTVAIDYAPDIMKALSSKGENLIDPKKDLRELLVEQSYFVPVRSFPYYLKNNEPLISEK